MGQDARATHCARPEEVFADTSPERDDCLAAIKEADRGNLSPLIEGSGDLLAPDTSYVPQFSFSFHDSFSPADGGESSSSVNIACRRCGITIEPPTTRATFMESTISSRE